MTCREAKFSDAISCGVVFWRSNSLSMIANSSVSLGWFSTASILSKMGFELVDLVDPPDMATAGELGAEPHAQDLVGQPEGNNPAAHRQHVGIVVLAGQAGGVQVVAQRGPHSLDLVGCYLLALPATAQHDAAVGVAGRHPAPDRGTDRRVVDRFLAMGAQVVDLVAQALQSADHVLLQRVAGVVGPDGDPHPTSPDPRSGRPARRPAVRSDWRPARSWPAEWTSASMPRASRRWRSMASAMAERHWFAVQMKRTSIMRV